MRDRGQQRVAQALGLDGNARGRGLVGALRALDRKRDLTGKGLEQVPLLRQQQAAALGGLHREHS